MIERPICHAENPDAVEYCSQCSSPLKLDTGSDPTIMGKPIVYERAKGDLIASSYRVEREFGRARYENRRRHFGGAPPLFSVIVEGAERDHRVFADTQ